MGQGVGEITCADGQTTRHELATDRHEVRGAYSVGGHVTSEEQEGSLVLHAGGWCDLRYWSGDAADQPVDETPVGRKRSTSSGSSRCSTASSGCSHTGG